MHHPGFHDLGHEVIMPHLCRNPPALCQPENILEMVPLGHRTQTLGPDAVSSNTLEKNASVIAMGGGLSVFVCIQTSPS